jgi:diaminohydroxyphosphoribosylaminopyrimidine deaminase/5-amino-6-(5-phosphoribosylamino)uracil reductase
MSAFLFAMRHRRPYVVAKAAFGLDGRIALPSGESQWITGPNARRAGHALRARLGAVLVGWRTVAADNPRLTARLPGVVNPPLRIVLDPHRRLSGKEAVFNDDAPTRHITGTIELSTVLSDLFEEGVTGLLVEGGAATISGFLTAGFVNRIEAFVAPKILGDGPSWVSGLNVQNLSDAVALGEFQITRRGSDIQIGADVVQKAL